MATCDLCKQKLPFGGAELMQIGHSVEYYHLCKDCMAKIKSAKAGSAIAKEELYNLATNAIPNELKRNEFCVFAEIPSTPDELAILRDSITKETEIDARAEQMILTTCPSIEGYSIVEQHGLVFGELIMKMGFLKRLEANVEELDFALAIDNELTRTTSMMNDAREYAIKKMKRDAVIRGANAIIGIDSESTMGGDYIKISIMGTAVKIEARDERSEPIWGK